MESENRNTHTQKTPHKTSHILTPFHQQNRSWLIITVYVLVHRKPIRMLVFKLLTALTIMKEMTLRCEGAKPLQVSFSSGGFAVTLSSGFSVTGTMETKDSLYKKTITFLHRDISTTLLHSTTSQITDMFLSL